MITMHIAHVIWPRSPMRIRGSNASIRKSVHTGHDLGLDQALHDGLRTIASHKGLSVFTSAWDNLQPSKC